MGSPDFFLIGIFLLLRSPYKISEPYDTFFWEKVTQAEREKEEKQVGTCIAAKEFETIIETKRFWINLSIFNFT